MKRSERLPIRNLTRQGAFALLTIIAVGIAAASAQAQDTLFVPAKPDTQREESAMLLLDLARQFIDEGRLNVA